MKIEERKEIPLYRSSYSLFLLILRIIKEVKKEYKYSIGEKLREEVMELIKNIRGANKRSDKEERKKKIEMAESNVETIILLCRVLFDVGEISLKKHAQISEMVENISRQLSGWKKSVK